MNRNKSAADSDGGFFQITQVLIDSLNSYVDMLPEARLRQLFKNLSHALLTTNPDKSGWSDKGHRGQVNTLLCILANKEPYVAFKNLSYALIETNPDKGVLILLNVLADRKPNEPWNPDRPSSDFENLMMKVAKQRASLGE